jgi:hypothetical protein
VPNNKRDQREGTVVNGEQLYHQVLQFKIPTHVGEEKEGKTGECTYIPGKHMQLTRADENGRECAG